MVMQQNALVSVVIPTYNYGRFVTEAVESALTQTYPNVEVIVVDDGSTDDTKERLAGYGDRIRYIYQENQGLSAARNTGLRAARGRFIALLDSDDAFHPRKLEFQVKLLEGCPDVGLVRTLAFQDLSARWHSIDTDPGTRLVSIGDLVCRTTFCPSSAMIRAECVEAVGYFDPAVSGTADRDYWIRAAARYAVAVLESPLTFYRWHSTNMSRQAERMTLHERAVIEKAFAMPELSGRRLLRRKARALADLASCLMYRDCGRHLVALKQLARSFVWWPLPFARGETAKPLFRLRVLVATLKGAILSARVPPVAESIDHTSTQTSVTSAAPPAVVK
jgi:glycosyltransferase involved in cell wall biosynthesis